MLSEIQKVSNRLAMQSQCVSMALPVWIPLYGLAATVLALGKSIGLLYSIDEGH